MKWIGQHIYDQISRFRDDVYIENLSTTVETNVLVVDSDGKVSKSTSVAGDLTSIVAGTGLSGTDLTGPIPTLNVDASQTQITGVGTITTGVWNGTAVASAYLDADTAHLTTTQTFTGTKTFDETISGAIDGNAATATALATARTIGGTSFDGTGNIAVAAATNLTASTSTAVALGTIELGHADDTTIARSAAGVVTIEGNKIETRKTLLHIQQTSFNRDIATTEYFIPFNSTAESANITNVNIPMVMPVAGKLLKIHFKVNQHHNTTSNTMTFKLYDVDDGELWSTGNSDILGTKVIDGPAREDVGIVDFTNLTTSGASGTNAFAAGDLIGVTVTNSVDLATTNYLITMVFELDFNSY